jgi:hypothetical protein
MSRAIHGCDASRNCFVEATSSSLARTKGTRRGRRVYDISFVKCSRLITITVFLLLAAVSSHAEALIGWDGGTGANTAFQASGIGGSLFTGKTGDYPDFDWSLTNLADRVLEHGEKADFNLVVSNAGTDWAFDNIAVLGGSTTNIADSILVSWRAETGREYTVMQSTNLLSNDWNPASGTLNVQPGDMSIPVELETPDSIALI